LRYITLAELGRLLGVGSKQIRSAHRAGFLTEPPMVSGRRAYNLGEVIRVAEYFGVKVSSQEGMEDERRSKAIGVV
jgi:hypothetical protein